MSRNGIAYDYPMVQGGRKSHKRFGRECGVRPLPGDFRCDLGNDWFGDKSMHMCRGRNCGRDVE